MGRSGPAIAGDPEQLGTQRTSLFVARGRYENLAGGRTASDEPLPKEYGFSQNHPNPFNPTTRIDFTLRAAGNVRVEVFNVLGERIQTLLDQEMPTGQHSVEWNSTGEAGKGVSSGVYFYRVVAGDQIQTRKMLLLK